MDNYDCICFKLNKPCRPQCGCQDFCIDSHLGCACKKTCSKDCTCFKIEVNCTDKCLKHAGGLVTKESSDDEKTHDCKRQFFNQRFEIKLFTAPSTLVPFCTGLFTYENIPSETFITYYTGEQYDDSKNHFINELSSINERERGLTYGFNLHSDLNNVEQFQLHKSCALDAHSIGNLMRFANHTDEEYANCKIKYLLGPENTYFLCLYSKVEIPENMELVFDYGIGEHSCLTWLSDYQQRFVFPDEKEKEEEKC